MLYQLLLGFTNNQLAQLEDNTELIEQREKEIQSIVQSISMINDMYKDLATMVVEQVSMCKDVTNRHISSSI